MTYTNRFSGSYKVILLKITRVALKGLYVLELMGWDLQKAIQVL